MRINFSMVLVVVAFFATIFLDELPRGALPLDEGEGFVEFMGPLLLILLVC